MNWLRKGCFTVNAREFFAKINLNTMKEVAHYDCININPMQSTLHAVAQVISSPPAQVPVKALLTLSPLLIMCLRNGTGRGIQAIVVYPMNALANSQMKELEKFLRTGLSQQKRSGHL